MTHYHPTFGAVRIEHLKREKSRRSRKLALTSILRRKAYDRQTLVNSAVSFLAATWLPIQFYV